MEKVIVHFGNLIPKEDFEDDEIRTRTLREGVHAIANIQGLTIGREFGASCAVLVEGTHEILERLRAVLEEKNLGKLSGDAEADMFYGAGKNSLDTISTS